MKANLIKTSFGFNAFSYLAQEKKGNALFVLFDAGETKALLPVMIEMDKAKIPYNIIAFGTAWNLMKKNPKTINIYSEIQLPAGISSTKWDRVNGIDPKYLEKIYELAGAKIVIEGMVSEIQNQIGKYFKKQGAEVFLYYDSFAPISTTYPFMLEMIQYASHLLVPSQTVAESAHALIPHLKVDVVGQPTIELWIDEIEKEKVAKGKSRLKLQGNAPFLLYISGYGEGYEEAFSSFAEAVQYVDFYQIGICLHPKMDGAMERKILKAYKCPHVFIIPKNIATSHIVSVADLVVTWRSTVGVQAAFLGKPVVYLDHESSTYSDLALEKEWAVRCNNPTEFLQVLVNFEKKEPISHGERLREGGVPQESAETIFKKVTKSKKRSYTKRRLSKPTVDSVFNKIVKPQ